jgi:AcrR family transcriptional regulator
MSNSFILELEAELRRKQRARLTAIATAALEVFTRDGFSSAQVVDIAKKAGLSVGTLYLYAVSKQALFELAMRAAALGADVGRDVDLATLPLGARGMDATALLLANAIHRRGHWPVLKAALRAIAPRDVDAEIAAVFGEMFDLLSRERPLIWLLDRCAWELPQLREVYLEGVQKLYFGDIARYVRKRRRMRPGSRGENPSAIGRALVEMVAWMAMHRARQPVAPPFDTAAARDACIAIASGGLLGTCVGVRRSPSSVPSGGPRDRLHPARPPPLRRRLGNNAM